MFSQFFGHYLLNNSVITNVQLNEALVKKSETRVKLGVLAINAGFMTAAQVEEVHQQQMRVDKRIGDIAVDMGFLTTAQVDELLGSQKSAHLLLGQTLVDLEYMTNAQFENALVDYKKQYQLDDSDFADETVDKTRDIVSEFLGFNDIRNFDFCVDYISLLFKTLTRFVSDEFTPLEPICGSDIDFDLMVTQYIKGAFSAYTAISFEPDAMSAFAAKYAKEDISDTEYAEAVASEFLNLHNGLFAVNVSTERNIELSLLPQVTEKNAWISTDNFCIELPISFPFGVVRFVIVL